MSIMPEGGWGVGGQQQNNEPTSESKESVQAVQPAYSEARPRSGGLICKVCDSGRLTSKSLFRMSGPAVVIGFILLVPSICGMIFSVLMLIGVIVTTSTSLPTQATQTADEAGFRKECAASFKQSYTSQVGRPPSKSLPEQYCEYALSEYKQSGSVTATQEVCVEREKNGTLAPIGKDVEILYSDTASTSSTDGMPTPFRAFLGVIGSVSAIVMLIASFVGGLFGWLLVMRKRVLQCEVCGAVVNAS